MSRLALCVVLLCAWAAAARADDDSKVPPAQYQNVSNDQLTQIINEHKELAQRFAGPNGKPDRAAMLAYFKSHTDVEPYLGLPTEPAQQKLFDDTFGKNAFQTTHDQAHFLLMGVVKEKPTPDAARDSVSKIIGGVSQIISHGLQYAGIKQQNLPADQARPLLEQADKGIMAADNLLATVPLKSPLGDNARAVLIAAEPKVQQLGAHGAVSVIAKVTGWDHVDQIVNQNSANPQLNVAVGDEALSRDDPARAKKYYDKALSIDPGNADALAGRGAANLDLGNTRAAAQDARDALAIDPQNAGAKAVLGLAHDTLGADVSIDKNNPFKNRVGDAAGVTSAGGGFGSGRAALAPGGGASLQSLSYEREAERALSLGDLDTALSRASRAILMDSRNAGAYAARAAAQTRAGNYGEALHDAVSALTLDPSNTLAHNARMKALNQMGRYDDALAAADDAIRANPRNAYAYYMKAMALQHIPGRRRDVIAALGQAAALDGRYQDAFDLAKSAPDEKDLSFLFPEEGLIAARAAAAGGSSSGPLHGVGLPTIVGAALLLFGLMHLAFSWAAPRLRAGYASAVRTGPALDAAGSAAPPPLPTPAPFATQRLVPMGTVLRGQYRRLGQIGSSVHGSVYEGLDQALQRRVVIRKLRADMRAADRERLLGPARAAAGLAHAGVAPVYAVFEEGEALYLVSEFAPGRSLRDQLAARGPLTWEEALPLFRQVAQALDYAHGKGVTHGAVKASNIMISPEGRAKLLDFGLTRGLADKDADLQALAGCLREAIAGLSPARLDAVDAALTKARGQLSSAAQVVDVIESCLSSAA